MEEARVEREELLPGIPDELVLQQVVPHLPYYTRALASTLSKRWRQTLLQLQGDLREQQRWRLSLHHHSGLLLRHGPSCRLTFLDFSDMRLHPLPSPPFAHRGLGAMFTFVFSVNQRIFAAQRRPSPSVNPSTSQFPIIERLFVLDIGAGLFQWQQRFGPPSRLHRPHVGDMRGTLQVSSPSQSAIFGSKFYVIADRLPPDIESIDILEAIRFYGQRGHGVPAAVYDAWEDSWEEIPSPLIGGGAMDRVLELLPSEAGVIASVHNYERFTTTSLTFLQAERQWHDISSVPVSMCVLRSDPCISDRSYLHFHLDAKCDQAMCTCCGGLNIGTYHACLYQGCLCMQPNNQSMAMMLVSKLGWRSSPTD